MLLAPCGSSDGAAIVFLGPLWFGPAVPARSHVMCGWAFGKAAFPNVMATYVVWGRPWKIPSCGGGVSMGLQSAGLLRTGVLVCCDPAKGRLTCCCAVDRPARQTRWAPHQPAWRCGALDCTCFVCRRRARGADGPDLYRYCRWAPGVPQTSPLLFVFGQAVELSGLLVLQVAH